jgi:hypothetical protein
MAQNYGPNIITDNLILALDAADINSYPRSGTTWYNLVNPSLNASINGGVSFSSINKGTMSFNGSNGIAYAPSVNSLGAIPNQTFEIWVKSPGLGSGKNIGGLICPDYGMISYIAANGNIVYYLYNSSTSSYVINISTSGVNCFDNNWHHIICTRGYSTAAIYVDGVLKTSASGGGNWSGTTVWSDMNIQIGNNPNDAYYNLYGNIGLAKIYRAYFSASDVLQNYNMTKSRFGL